MCHLPFDLSSVLESSTCAGAEEQNQAVQMFKTWVFDKMNYQLFRECNVGYTQRKKTTVIKINS